MAGGMKSWHALLLVAAVACGAVAASVAAQGDQPAVSLRDVNEQVVLYTIYRGPYEGVGQAIVKLFQMAGPKGLTPTGRISFVYLNNPALVSTEHYLTEIRFPVAEDALKLAGTLGEFTDVKKLPAMQVAVIHKPIGVADPSGLRKALSAWVRQNGYETMDSCYETFFNRATDYAQMENEILYPVRKLAEQP